MICAHGSGRPLYRSGAEHVRTQLISSDIASYGLFDSDAVMSGHWTLAVTPLPYEWLCDADCPSQGALAAGYRDSELNFGGIHGATLAMLPTIVKSVAHRQSLYIRLASLI